MIIPIHPIHETWQCDYVNTLLSKKFKCPICDNSVFIASCINETIGDETQWPTIK